jgi:aspartyl protease family protein
MKVKWLFLIGVAAIICAGCDEMNTQTDSGELVLFEDEKIDLDEQERGRKEDDQRPSNSTQVEKEVIRMRLEGGVYKVPIKVNGIPMEFILDTGSSLVSISPTEALFLYKNGSLTNSDVLGKRNFLLANGEVQEGVVVRLKSIQIGEKVLYDIPATIDSNINAPLLLGQSILNRFGKVTIDNQNGKMELEY